MRWLILFFIFALMGLVVADGVEIQVENTTTDTNTAVFSTETPYFGYGLIAVGLTVLSFMLFTIYMSHRKKKVPVQEYSKHHARRVRKDLLSWFLGKEKERSLVLSQHHYAPIQEYHDESEWIQKRNDELLSLKQDILHEFPKVLDEDVRRVLKITDDLLGEIPEQKIETFVHSPDFEVYKKVMKKVSEPLHENTEGVEKMQKVLDLFEKGVIDIDEARKMLGLSIRHIHIVKTQKKDKDEVLQELKKVRHEAN